MKADLPPSLDFSSSSPPPPSSVHLSSAISRQDPSFSSSSSFLSPSLLLSRSCLSSSSSSSSSSVSSRNGNLYLSVQRDKGVLVSLTPTLTEEDISCFVATVHARTSEKERRRSKCLEASSLRTSPFSPSSSSSSSSLYPPSRSSTGDKQKLSHSLVSRRSEEEEDVESSGSNFHREDTPSEGEKEEEEAKKEKRRRRRRKIEEGHAQATEEKKEEEEEEEEMYGISLRGVGLQDDSLSILVTCILRSQFLRIIDLSDNRLTDESVRILAECMPCLPYLRYLNLSHNSRLTVESLVKISKAFFPDFSTSSSSSTIVSTSSSSSSSLPLSRREEKMIEKNDTVSLRASESMHSNQHHRGGPSHTIEVSRPSHLAGRYFSRVERREGRKALTKEEEEEEKRKRGVYHLDLSDNFLGPEGCCSIAETIKCNSCLARLYLRNTGGECGGLLPLMATETFLKALDFSHADLSSSSFSRSSSPAPPPPAAPLASPPPASLSSSPSSFPLLPQSRSSRFFFSSSSSSCSMPLCEAKAVGEGRRVSVSSLFVQDERSIEREEKSHVFQRDSNCVMSTSRATTTSTTVFSTSTTASHDIVIAASQSPDRHEQLYGSSSSSPSSSSGTKDEGLVAMVEANEKKSFSATSPSSSTSMVTSVLSSSMFLRPFRRAPRPEARSTPGKGERDMKRKGEKSHSSHSTIMDDRRREIYRDEKDSEDTKRKECAIRMNVMKEERREKEKERRASLRSLKKKGFFTSSSQQGDGDGGREEEDWMREIEGYSSLYSPVEGQEDEKERDLERRRLAGRDLQMLLCISEGLSHLLTASNALQELNLSYCTWSSSSISHPYHDTKRSKGKHGPQTTSSLPSRLGGDLGKEDCGRREREEKMYGVQYADQLIDILAEALKKNTSLRSLAFAGNGMTAVGLRRLCEGLGGDASVCRIEELNLACNDLHEALPLAELLLINHTIRIVDVANCVLSGEAIEHLLSALEGNDTLSILVLAHNSMNRQSISKLAEVLKYQHARIFMKEERTKEEEEGKRNEESEDDRKEGRDKKDEEEEKRKIRVEIENREEKKDMTVEDKKKEDGEVPRDEEGSDDEKKEERKASREKNPTHSTLGSSSPDHRHDSNESSSYSPPDNSSSYSPSPPSCSPPPFPCCCSWWGCPPNPFNEPSSFPPRMSLAPAARQRLLSLRRKATLQLLARQEKHFFSLQSTRRISPFPSCSPSPPSSSCARKDVCEDVERRDEDSEEEEEDVDQEEKKRKKEKRTNERKERRSEAGRQNEGEKQRGPERGCIFYDSRGDVKRIEEEGEEEVLRRKEKEEEEEDQAENSTPFGRDQEKENKMKDRSGEGEEFGHQCRGMLSVDRRKKKKNSETSLHAQKGRSAREKKKRQFCSACHGYVLDREEYEHLGLASGDGECSGIERDFELGFASLSQLPRRGLRMVDLSFTIPRDGSALLPLAQALPHLPLLLFLDVSSCALDTEVVDSFREVSSSSSLLSGGERSRMKEGGLGGRDRAVSPLSPLLPLPPVSPSSSSSSSISYPYSLVVRGLPLTAIRLDEEDDTEEEEEEQEETARSEKSPSGDKKERGGGEGEGGGVYESYPSGCQFSQHPPSTLLLPPTQVNIFAPSITSSSSLSHSSRQTVTHLPGDEVSIRPPSCGRGVVESKSSRYPNFSSSLSCTPLPFSRSTLPLPPSLVASSSPAEISFSLENNFSRTQSLPPSSSACHPHPPQMLSDSLHAHRFLPPSQFPPFSPSCRYTSEGVERLSSTSHLVEGSGQLVLAPPPPPFYTASSSSTSCSPPPPFQERGEGEEGGEQEGRLSSPPLPPPRLISQAELKEEHRLLQRLTRELKPQLFPDQIEQLERLRELQEEQILLQQRKEELEQAFLTQLSASASGVCTAGGGGGDLRSEAGRTQEEKRLSFSSPSSSSFHRHPFHEKKEEGEEQREKEEEERRMVTDPLEWLGTSSPS